MNINIFITGECVRATCGICHNLRMCNSCSTKESFWRVAFKAYSINSPEILLRQNVNGTFECRQLPRTATIANTSNEAHRCRLGLLKGETRKSSFSNQKNSSQNHLNKHFISDASTFSRFAILPRDFPTFAVTKNQTRFLLSFRETFLLFNRNIFHHPWANGLLEPASSLQWDQYEMMRRDGCEGEVQICQFTLDEKKTNFLTRNQIIFFQAI